RRSQTTLPIHRSQPNQTLAYIPATHHPLIDLITQSLQHIPITLQQPPHHISATQQNNILNITQTQPPLQLQLTAH
ncbi:poly-gamma-glutamate hydrolase family protein, partial [Staphylococcus epidermidis]|uniref:poly-gamma-glutamate hydrolase family protein n=1 Tax=Staphylococcus epidermidis TaxID=1282 RepID=UPI0016427062